jgi:hypothetical protein
MPVSMTKRQFAAHIGVAHMQPGRWAALGMPMLPNGRVPVAEAADWVRRTINPNHRIGWQQRMQRQGRSLTRDQLCERMSNDERLLRITVHLAHSHALLGFDEATILREFFQLEPLPGEDDLAHFDRMMEPYRDMGYRPLHPSDVAARAWPKRRSNNGAG